MTEHDDELGSRLTDYLQGYATYPRPAPVKRRARHWPEALAAGLAAVIAPRAASPSAREAAARLQAPSGAPRCSSRPTLPPRQIAPTACTAPPPPPVPLMRVSPLAASP